ncbi:MAG: alpha/beta fold hydrolase [Lentisphaeria bacterium]|nr:alpha/beta fold hydrolase [Lentisphaeria bacterium]
MKKTQNCESTFRRTPTVADAGSFDRFPQGVVRITYRSDADGLEDRALAVPGAHPLGIGIVVLHGHGSGGDQLFTWKQLGNDRDFLRRLRCGVLSPDLRGNAWMCPEAVEDLAKLITFAKKRFKWRKVILASGSMGGTGGLIFASHHPELADAVIALGAATDLASYVSWCGRQKPEVCGRIAEAIRTAYKNDRELMKTHSTLARWKNLTMPVWLCHGAADEIIPVSQSRRLAGKMAESPGFVYREVWRGDHDSPMLSFTECVSQAIFTLF